MNFFKNRYRSSLLPVQLLSLLILVLCVSCQWNKRKGDSLDKTSPNKSGVESPTSIAAKATDISFIKKTPDNIKGADRIIKLDIENKGAATTEKGKLKLLIERQVGSAAFIEGSTLTQDGKYYTLELPALVDPNQGKFSYDLKIDPKSDDKATFKIRLQYNNTDINNPFVVSWEKGELPKEVDLYLTRTSPEKLEGKERTITLAIENKGPKDTEPGKAKLRIERTDGKAAFITTSTQTVGNSIYTLKLPLVKAQNKLSHNLTIDPQNDLKASFKIQLQYNNANVGNPLMVNWEKGATLEVVNITKDPTTGQVNAEVKNTGTKVAESGKVTAEVKTKGADLGGNLKKEVEVKDVKPGEVKTLPLALVNFGKTESGQDNKTAVCEFQTCCSTDCPEAPKPTIIKTFTKSEIVIAIDIEDYDIGKPTFTLKLKNTGKDVAEGLKLKYNNISGDSEGKLATLDNKTQDHGITIGNLAKDQEYKHTFTVDLKDAEQAEFDFKVIYDNNSIGEIKKKFQAKPLKLSLEVVKPSMDDHSNYILYGAENAFELRINQKTGSRAVLLEYLTLSIQALEGEAGVGGTISQILHGPAINKVVGNELGALGSNLTLYIHPNVAMREASFKCQLKYKGRDIAEPVLVEWREYPMNITSPERLVGDQEGTFQIISAVPIDLKALHVTLEGNQGTTFQLYQASGDEALAGAALVNVAEYATTDRNATKPIKFRINQKNGQKEAKLHIILRRGTSEIARRSVDWVDQGIGLSLQLNRYDAFDIQPLIFSIKNTTTQRVDLHKVKIKLSNTDNISFTLGNTSGVVVEKKLADITGQNTLDGETKLYSQLHINTPLGDKLATGLVLQLLDNNDQLIDQAYFLYYARYLVIETEFAKMLDAQEREFLRKLEEAKNDVGILICLQAILTKAITAYRALSDKLSKIIDTDLRFEPLVKAKLALYADDIKKWEKFKALTQATLSQSDDEEKVILEWCEKIKKDLEAIENKIKDSTEEVKKLNKIPAIINFLLIDYDNTQGIDQQSIKALYERYKGIGEAVKALLDSRGIVYFESVNGDSPSIKELKEIYNRITAASLATKNQIQQVFNAGFLRFGEIIRQEQNGLKLESKDKNNEAKIQALSRTLTDQKAALKRWKRQTDYEKELIPNTADVQNQLVKFYEDLAEKNLAIATAVTSTSRDHGNLKKFAILGVQIAGEVLELAQTMNSQPAGEAATKAYKAAIKAWKIHETKRRVPNSSLRRAQLVKEADSDEFKLTPTILQVLESDLKGLKDNYREKAPQKDIFRKLNWTKRSKKLEEGK